MNIPASSLFPYLTYFETINGSLAGLQEFCFYPGMLFGSWQKWWPDAGMRQSRHEGLDICYITDRNGEAQGFDAQIRVPVIDSGVVLSLCADFLGRSVFVEHVVSASLRLLSVYAHIIPHAHIHVGMEIAAGEGVGHVADTTGRKNNIPAHVHVSLLTIPHNVHGNMLDWEFICKSGQVELIDPLTMIRCEKVKLVTEIPGKINTCCR